MIGRSVDKMQRDSEQKQPQPKPGRAVDPVRDPNYKRRKAHGEEVSADEVREALGLKPGEPLP